MAETTDPAGLVAVLRTEGKNTPKPLCFNLKNQLKDEAFAQAFVEEGGMAALMGVATQATGNVQTYALIALRVAISHTSGAEGALQKEELLEQLVELLGSPLLPVAKQVAEILSVLSCSAPSSWRRIHQAAKTNAKAKGKKPYASLIQCIAANDLDLQVNAIALMNNLLSAAPERMRKFLNVWRDLGAEDKLKVVAQTTKYDVLISQVQQYQRKLLAVFPEAAHIIDDPSLQPSPAPTAMSRTRKGTITIAKKVAAVGTLRKRDKEGDSKANKKEHEKDDDHSAETTPEPVKAKPEEEEREKGNAVSGVEEQNDEASKEKEKQKKKLKDKLKAKKQREADAEQSYQKASIEEKLKAYESQQPLIRLLKYELKRQEVAINEALSQGAHINAHAPLKRYVERVDEMSVEMPVELSSLLTPNTNSSLDEVKMMREKMESLAGQVEKLKEVGKALVSKKESEIQVLKKEIAELNEDKNHHKKELEGLRRELQRKEEMAEYAEERSKRESLALESKRESAALESKLSQKDSPSLMPAPAASPSALSSSSSTLVAKEAEDLRSEVERLKRELGEARTDNDTLRKAEKQRAANAALLVKEMKAEAKHYASTSEMIDDFQSMKEQVMKLQLLKEQVIKEMRQIKKTAFVGFPEFSEKLGGIDGLEMKQIQEELERERKEKEAAQAEVLLLKTKISEIGSPEEVEELRKRNAELVQTNQKVTKENTALRVSMLEARMKSKQDAKQAPAKSNEDMERLETELAHKDREVEEEKAGKEKALTQLKTMMKVMKVLKTKYDTELETKKQTEAEMATLRERLAQREADQQQQPTSKEGKKKNKSASEVEDDNENLKRKVKELEEEKAKWAKERSEIELRLEESQRNEYTSTNAAFSLNEHVEKLEAELNELRAERQETTLQDKVARLEKEKKDLQDQFGKELNELRGQTASLYEADIRKLKDEVSRLQREKQMACQLLVSSNDKLKKMEVLLDTFKKDATKS